MKKRIIALLLSALLLASATACNKVPETNDESTLEDTNTTESTVEETEEETTEGETNTETKYTIACNGAYRNSNVKYAITEEGKLILYIGDWNESFIVPNENMYFVFETLFASSVVIGENRGALIYNDFSRPTKPIKVIQFTKGNQKVTIENLNFETLETSENHYAFKYCSFIDEQTGYLFLFNEVNARYELTKMLKTTNGGKTWIEQPVEVTPSIWWREDIICAKMVDENVGIISGGYWANDYDFCQRTFLTTNGGRNWECISTLPKINILFSPEVIDFTKYEGSYVLTVRHITSENGYEYAKYQSSDLNIWMHMD